MYTYVVTHTRRYDHLNRHESISHLVGPFGELAVSQVILIIATGLGRFVTQDAWGGSAPIQPWPHLQTGPYLRTVANGWPNDNLLMLQIV